MTEMRQSARVERSRLDGSAPLAFTAGGPHPVTIAVAEETGQKMEVGVIGARDARIAIDHQRTLAFACHHFPARRMAPRTFRRGEAWIQLGAHECSSYE